MLLYILEFNHDIQYRGLLLCEKCCYICSAHDITSRLRSTPHARGTSRCVWQCRVKNASHELSTPPISDKCYFAHDVFSQRFMTSSVAFQSVQPRGGIAQPCREKWMAHQRYLKGDLTCVYCVVHCPTPCLEFTQRYNDQYKSKCVILLKRNDCAKQATQYYYLVFVQARTGFL